MEVDWNRLPAVTDIATARDGAAHQVHEGLAGNCLVDLLLFDDERLGEIFAGAPLVVRGVFTSARVAALPLEGRACLAEWADHDEDERKTDLENCWEQFEAGEMPKWFYVYPFHMSAKLSAADKALLKSYFLKDGAANDAPKDGAAVEKTGAPAEKK